MPRNLTQHNLVLALIVLVAHVTTLPVTAQARKARAPAGGRTGLVVDERLSALREAPDFSSNVAQRLGRGRTVSIRGERRAGDVTFYRVALTRRTGGWIQADALVSPSRAGDDERLLRLARGSEDFDRVERAALFLETFPRSPHKPAALMLLGDAAVEAARKLSRDAARRLNEREMAAGGAPARTYFLNYSGLDRYRRQGIVFTFDAATKQYIYDGAAWREIVRRHPRSPEAAQANQRLKSLPAVTR